MGERSNKVGIESAIKILNDNYLNILTVTEWAYAMGYSRSYFCRTFSEEFGINPKDYLKLFRLRLIKKEIKKDPDAIGYKIAVLTGLSNEKALHKFLNTHFDKNLTVLRSELAAA